MLLRILVFFILVGCAAAQSGNRLERLEWFRDLGLGLFIHWSLDSQTGSVISHSMVGASDDYIDRFVNELPRTFNPKEFDAVEWARLARLSGFTYVVFTAKHHSGFCMYDTETTDFSIMNTPFGRDVTREIIDAFRAEGLAIGHYFSPDDFDFLRRQGTLISRHRPEVLPSNNPELLRYDQRQVRELMTNYGSVDFFFIDGEADGLREVVWEVQPNAIVTRGAMVTPEQYTPGVPLEGAWEGNLTMGGQWQYRPTNETYKSGTQLIKTLIEMRAKGGNLLLNIGPKPNGEIPIEQEGRMREMALWNMVNREAIGAVRPWVITNEGDVWFTKAKDENTVYAFVTGDPWPYGERKTITLRSIRSTDATKTSVLGQNDLVLEYVPDVDPKTTWNQTEDALEISAMRAQRIYNDRRWPNPVVLKITNVEAALSPPIVISLDGTREGTDGTMRAELKSLGDAAEVEVGFEARRQKSTAEMYEPDFPWKGAPAGKRTAAGVFESAADGLDPSRDYEFRAWAQHPLVRIYSAPATFEAPK